MRIKRFSVILAVLLVAILALGAVSAESIDDANLDLADDSADAVSIDSIDDVSVDTTDKNVKNSLSANIVGNESGTDEGEGEEMANYDIDDGTYSTYFNEDGTPTDKLSVEGNYSLNIGTLTNKDIKIDAGNNILIINKPDEGTIYNGTITIGTGDTAMKSISIAGLAFINENKDAIVINELCSDVSIDSNSLDLTYDNESISRSSAIAIKTNGYVKNVVISNNQIFMDSVVNYTYGIDIAYYKTWTEYAIANPEAVDLLDNVIEITSSAESGMAEAIYFDTAINSLIDANEITVTTINKDVANYALQVADSWGFYNDPFAFSPSNITISGNEITQNSADMAYGITVISLTDFDEDNAKIEKFFNISDNIVEINSESDKSIDENSNSDDSFIKEQYKSFNKLNKEKELLDKEKENQEKKEIEKKNDFAIRKANKEVLKARGIYRKRKKYQGNAKLMNREKFYKKEKERRKLVKEYEGKPDVYMGEATGIRRDLIRSTKIH